MMISELAEARAMASISCLWRPQSSSTWHGRGDRRAIGPRKKPSEGLLHVVMATMLCLAGTAHGF